MVVPFVPELVAGPLKTLTLTGNPELELGETVKGTP